MSKELFVNLICDTSKLDEPLAELQALSFSKPEIFKPLRDRISSLEELVSIEVKDNATPGTNDLLVIFKPSDTLTDLIATLRAGDIDRLAVE